MHVHCPPTRLDRPVMPTTGPVALHPRAPSRSTMEKRLSGFLSAVLDMPSTPRLSGKPFLQVAPVGPEYWPSEAFDRGRSDPLDEMRGLSARCGAAAEGSDRRSLERRRESAPVPQPTTRPARSNREAGTICTREYAWALPGSHVPILYRPPPTSLPRSCKSLRYRARLR
jgi:hypothetical protein